MTDNKQPTTYNQRKWLRYRLLVIGGTLLLFCGSLAFLEFLNASAGVEDFFFSRKEWVACTANFHLKFFHGGSYGKFLPASTNCLCLRIVCRMYIGFHRLKSNRNMSFWQSPTPMVLLFCFYKYNTLLLKKYNET